ncbi:MAG: methylated-DNA--[protein]-cysteine S-methyltransferase [Armatimonadetes bacterium]|nr:methylated-DNA--[protein]-cysteine S-methyltransferase [Armatimonadota bacterium]
MTYYCTFNTKSGWIALAGHDGKLAYSTLPQKTREEALKLIESGLNENSVEDIGRFGDLPDKLERYFDGEKVDFSNVEIDLGPQGPFIEEVQREAQKIPYGTLVTYGELARMAGRAKAARAAGSAMARNPVPIIVPCHRVVAAGGAIGGFGPGLEWKRVLLRIEGVDI